MSVSTIRLTITPELRKALDFLKSVYPLLKEDEILKLALSEFYTGKATVNKVESAV